jgi:hypothetical protein
VIEREFYCGTLQARICLPDNYAAKRYIKVLPDSQRRARRTLGFSYTRTLLVSGDLVVCYFCSGAMHFLHHPISATGTVGLLLFKSGW